jgi:hypothetical protein
MFAYIIFRHAPALMNAWRTDAAVAKFASKMLVMTIGRLLVSIEAICCAAARSLGKQLETGWQELSYDSSLLRPASPSAQCHTPVPMQTSGR